MKNNKEEYDPYFIQYDFSNYSAPPKEGFKEWKSKNRDHKENYNHSHLFRQSRERFSRADSNLDVQHSPRAGERFGKKRNRVFLWDGSRLYVIQRFKYQLKNELCQFLYEGYGYKRWLSLLEREGLNPNIAELKRVAFTYNYSLEWVTNQAKKLGINQGGDQ